LKTLDQWLRLLESRHPVEIELGLARISAVARNLNIGAIANKVVVVAGTNGKGSCVRTLESLAIAAGLQVATYTSPHLIRYNERVRIQGQDVADALLCEAFETIDAQRGDTPLTYFEVGTLAALLVMAAHPLDLAVLEIGLGGRYDAVNIIDGDVAVLTSIALDHQHWLGDNREVIGREKAGIARAGRPVVCADPNPPASVVDYLAEIAAKPYYAGQDFHLQQSGDRLHLSVVDGDGGILDYPDLPIPVLPVASVAAAVQTMALLGFSLSPTALAEVVGALALAGRYQKLRFRNRDIILDVAHNPAAAHYLADKLRAEAKPCFAVVAIMADKDVAGFAAALADTVDHWFVGDLEGLARALPGRQLGQTLTELGLAHTLAPSIEDAFDQALRQLPEQGTLVVCGSFFTLAAIMKYLELGNDL
jgi:dihydrofolate synthase / folylpolyglutamate synthase